MNKQTEIPKVDGLYWYYETNAKAPRPVLINQSRHGRLFKSFNGSEQSWIRPGEYFLGPVEPIAVCDSCGAAHAPGSNTLCEL